MSKTFCMVKIDGKDISSGLMPKLEKLSVTDKAGTSSDTCEIEIDDANGEVMLPRVGVVLEVFLGPSREAAIRVFRGKADEVKSAGSRKNGMKLTVSAKGVDTKGKAKQPAQKHWDNKSLKDVMSEAGKDAGINSVTISPELSGITRKYWAMQNESFLHFGERIAREVGGTFKIQDDRAIIAERNGGKSATGKSLPDFKAEYGVNLLSWEISPVLGRPRYKKTKVRHYDPKTATHKEEEVEIQDSEAESDHTDRYVAADADEAKTKAKANKKSSEREKGGGSISVNGSTIPQPEGNVILIGARPGIDGTYRIDGVQHDYSRKSGWTTKLDVKQPQGDAGKDKRKAKAK